MVVITSINLTSVIFDISSVTTISSSFVLSSKQTTDNTITQMNSTATTPDTTALPTLTTPVVTAATSASTTATLASTTNFTMVVLTSINLTSVEPDISSVTTISSSFVSSSMQTTDNAITQMNSTAITPDTTVLPTLTTPVVTAATSALTTATLASTTNSTRVVFTAINVTSVEPDISSFSTLSSTLLSQVSSGFTLNITTISITAETTLGNVTFSVYENISKTKYEKSNGFSVPNTTRIDITNYTSNPNEIEPVSDALLIAALAKVMTLSGAILLVIYILYQYCKKRRYLVSLSLLEHITLYLVVYNTPILLTKFYLFISKIGVL